MTAAEFKQKLEIEIDRIVADKREEDRDLLLEHHSAADVERIMRNRDAKWQKWRDETVAELFAKTKRFVSDPRAVSLELH
jgi:hypothetical protein